MKERPILFSAPMVRAILNGTKTQTRRVVNGIKQPGETKHPMSHAPNEAYQLDDGQVWRFDYLEGVSRYDVRCPFGQIGDRLWVREAWRTIPSADRIKPRDLMNVESLTHYEADAAKPTGMGKLRPSMFMPRWASRITLEVTGVRVERLQDISEADAVAEGIERAEDFFGCPCWKCYGEDADVVASDDPVGSYQSLWESINGAGSWDANPWVWVVEFKPVV